MRLLKNEGFRRGLHVFVMAVTVFNLSFYGVVFHSPTSAQAVVIQYTLEGQKTDGTFTPGNICSGGVTCYNDGDNVPHKLTISGLTTSTAYTVKIQHDHKDASAVDGYVDFNTPDSWDGDASAVSLSNIVDGTTVITYDLNFTADATEVELKWNALLGPNASSWNGAQLHVRLVEGVSQEQIGNKEVPLLVNKIGFSADSMIHGTKWYDWAHAGVVDEHATWPIEGWAINLFFCGEGVNLGKDCELIDSTTTDVNGEYWFPTGQSQLAGLQPGEYHVCEEVPAGWNATQLLEGTVYGDSYCRIVQVDGTTQYHNEDFFNSSIQGTKYYDWDHSGDLSDGDENLPGWNMKLWADSNGNQNIDNGEIVDTTVTNDHGHYWFYYNQEYQSESYYVCEVLPNGWQNSQAFPEYFFELDFWHAGFANICSDIHAGPEELKLDIDFFNYDDIQAIHGQKWNDLNGDGEWNQNEPALNGWEISLYQDGQLLDQMDTMNHDNQDGWYWFEGLRPGTYEICETQQAGWAQTAPSTPDGCHTIELPMNLGVVGATTDGPAQPVFNTTCTVRFNDLNQVVQIENAVASLATCDFGNQEVFDFNVDITKTADVSEVAPGDEFTYTIDWTLTGNLDVDDLEVVDDLPSNVTFVSASGAATYDLPTHTVTWNYGAQSPVTGDTETITVTVNDDVVDGEEIFNEATVTGTAFVDEGLTQIDPPTLFLGDFGIASQEILVQKSADDDAAVVAKVVTPEPVVLGEVTEPELQINKQASQSFANPGDTVQYTIVVKNVGDGAAFNVVVTDTLPAGFTYGDGDTTKTWNLSDMIPDETKEIMYNVINSDPIEAGTYVNIAVASADNHDLVQDDAKLDVRVPAVLGALADTGIGLRDLFILLNGLALILAGAWLLRPERQRNISQA